MMAKKIFMISIVFMALLLSIPADGVETTTEMVPRPIPKEVLDKFVADVNERRRTLAKNHNIANMHELTWNQMLADAVSGIARSDMKMNFVQGNSFEKHLTELDEFISQIAIDLKKGSKDGQYTERIDFLSPRHRDIGCAERVYDDAYWKDCFLTPGTLYGMTGYKHKKWDTVEQIISVQGDPGSQCYEGYGNNDGLCTLLPTTTTTTTTEEPTTTTTEEPTTEEPTTPEPVPTTEKPEVPGPEDKDPKDNDAPAPDAPKPQQSPVTEKQSSDEQDSGESEDVTDSEKAGSSALLFSVYSVLLSTFLVQFWAFFCD